MQVGEQPVGCGVRHGDPEQGRAVAPALTDQSRALKSPALLGLEQPSGALLTDLRRDHVQDPPTQRPQRSRTEVLRLPDEADTARCPARQVECVREAETLVLQDLSVRRPARELADHFGLSESGFKLYCQNVLGEGYLAYFRRRRLERAAELLRTTPQRVQDIAARVGYESQGRFAQAFYDQFRLTPLEYRRLSK